MFSGFLMLYFLQKGAVSLKEHDKTYISVISMGRLSGMCLRPLFLQSTTPSAHLQPDGQLDRLPTSAVQLGICSGTPRREITFTLILMYKIMRPCVMKNVKYLSLATPQLISEVLSLCQINPTADTVIC